MTGAERLAERTPERIWLIDMGDCIAWCDDPDPSGTGEDDAVEYVRATLIRSQAEELERLRGALGETQKPKLITPVAVLNDDGSQSFSSQALGEM